MQSEELKSWLVTPPPPPPSLEYPAWSDSMRPASPLDIRRRIMCNRSLNMAKIKVLLSACVVTKVNVDV